jgi:hypothetical protein
MKISSRVTHGERQKKLVNIIEKFETTPEVIDQCIDFGLP